MTKVAIISGGSSCEREVSLNTGKQIYQHCDPDKYVKYLFDFQPDNSVSQVDRNNILYSKTYSWVEFLNQLKIDNFDVVIIALHGADGEDGYIQSILEKIDLPYVGSNSKSSALAMNKYNSASFFKENGLKVPLKYLLSKSTSKEENIQTLKNLSGKHIIKPNALGSSVGLFALEAEMNIKEKEIVLEKVFEICDVALIEEYIAGREFACGILEYPDNKVEILPPIEIITGKDLFDYNAKYKEDTTEVCPANINNKVADLIKRTALNAHNILGCTGLSRSDFIVTDTNDIYILELNTLPGMTATSLFPKEFISTGRTFKQLVDILIEKALS